VTPDLFLLCDLCSASSRGYPDISAQALNFITVIDNIATLRNGTSCAVSTVVGIISLINDFLISHDKPPLGFLNLWLYDDGLEGISDIISGSNPGCNTNGFSAIAGWDPVTGLGTLNFEKLLEILQRKF
jgi:tripeptidyl-peptidase-1